MKEKTVCLSGHRNIPEEKYEEIQSQLLHILSGLIQKGYRFFGTGGALGFDTMAAKAILALKHPYPHIRLILVLPCKTQVKNWCEHDKAVYESIKSLSDKVVYTSDAFSSDCMHKRNRHLVDHSSICVCYLTKQSGGTAYTVNYARKNNLQIINIGDNRLPPS